MRIVDIKGYEGRYQVDENGDVYSLPRFGSKFKERIKMKTHVTMGGYRKVQFAKNGKRICVFIHRLIAEYFIPNPDGKRCVNHIDGNKNNNHPSNLEWCTQQENIIHAFSMGLMKGAKGEKASAAKLTEIQVLAIRADKRRPYEIAKDYPVSYSMVLDIVNGKYWKHLLPA